MKKSPRWALMQVINVYIRQVILLWGNNHTLFISFSTAKCWKTIIVNNQRRTQRQPPRTGYQRYTWPEIPPPPATHQKKDIVVLKRA